MEHTGLLISLLILIIMLGLCHTNKLFLRNNELFNPYNEIMYSKNKIPCNNQAQIPCKVMKEQCSKPTKYELSDSELALLYKETYEMTGKEILRRALKDMQTTTSTTAATLAPS